MITIYDYNYLSPHLSMYFIDNQMFFDLNNSEYVYIRDPEYAHPVDIEIIHGNNKTITQHKIGLVFDIYVNIPNQLKKIQLNSNQYCITNAYDPDISNQKIIYIDFLFNCTKAYYSQYPFRYDTKIWHWYGQESFIAFPLAKHTTKNKIFIAPLKTHGGTRKYRQKLFDLLYNKYANQGYIGNYTQDKKLFLYPQIEFPWGISIEELEQCQRTPSYTALGYLPPHNEYYKNTFISIYTESIESGTSIAITEKTFDPMIKGHFVLPFSNAGFVNRLINQGFRLPNFIDYSYDKIANDDARYLAYSNEVKRLLNFDIDHWRQLWVDNLDIINYNKRIFHERPYDRVNFSSLLE